LDKIHTSHGSNDHAYDFDGLKRGFERPLSK